MIVQDETSTRTHDGAGTTAHGGLEPQRSADAGTTATAFECGESGTAATAAAVAAADVYDGGAVAGFNG